MKTTEDLTKYNLISEIFNTKDVYKISKVYLQSESCSLERQLYQLSVKKLQRIINSSKYDLKEID